MDKEPPPPPVYRLCAVSQPKHQEEVIIYCQLFDVSGGEMEVRDDALSEYLNDENDRKYESFADFFEECLDEVGLIKSDFVKRCRIERTYVYQILKGLRNPGREKVIIMCIAAGLDLASTQKALVIAREGILYYRNERDAAIIYAVRHNYSLTETNSLLARNELEELS